MVTKKSVFLNGFKLPVFYKDGELLKTMDMNLWGCTCSPSNCRGIPVKMLIKPWILESTMVILARSKTSEGTNVWVGYPVIPKDILAARPGKKPSRNESEKLAIEELVSYIGEDNFYYEAYTCTVKID